MSVELKEGKVYTLVITENEGIMPAPVGPVGDHVSKMKAQAKEAVPRFVGVGAGAVEAVIIRVEAVIPFAPRLVPIEAATTASEQVEDKSTTGWPDAVPGVPV